MNRVQAIAERVRKGQPLPFAVGPALAAFTPATRAGMWLRRMRPVVNAGVPVVSFGNITVGGTGKTPAVIERVRRETRAGRRVAILTRGYGGAGPEMTVVRGADGVGPEEWKAIGDEPALIAMKCPEAAIIKASDRVAAARHAVDDWGCDLCVLDDGYQYLRLARDENVLMIDAGCPFGSGRLIPRGILREPVAAVRRATHVIITRADQARDLDSLVAELRRYLPGAPVRLTVHEPVGLWRLADGECASTGMLDGAEVQVLSGIARPEAFRVTLESLGAHVAGHRILPDHAPIDEDDVPEGPLVVTTEKDAVRMGHRFPHVWALAVELRDSGAKPTDSTE